MARAERAILGKVHEAPIPILGADEVSIALGLCAIRGVVRNGEPFVKISDRALAAMEQSCGAVSPLSCAGVLLGSVYKVGDNWHVVVQETMSFKATPDMHRVRVPRHAWQDVLRQRKALFPQLRVVGWYHSHPGLGARFSEADSFVQRFFFPADWQVACVVDPERHEAQFFSRRGRNVLPLGAFWVDHARVETTNTGGLLPEIPRAPTRDILEKAPGAASAAISPRPAFPEGHPLGPPASGLHSRAPACGVTAVDSPIKRNGGKPQVAYPEVQNAHKPGEDYLKERFVERSLEKILRTLKEPRLSPRDFLMMGFMVVLLIMMIAMIVARTSATAELNDISQKLDKLVARLDAMPLSGARKPTRPANPVGLAEQKAPPEGTADTEHVMAEGETVWNVAEQYYGDGALMDALLRYNHISDARELRAGALVKVPSRGKLAVSRTKKAKPIHTDRAPVSGPPPPTPH